MKKPSPKTAAKEPFVLKACNDPEREDWGFFRNLFLAPPTGETSIPLTPQQQADAAAMRPLLETPSDPAEARTRLRLLLQMAHAKHPWRLLNMTLMGEGKGNMRGTIKAFAMELRSRGVDLTTSVYDRNTETGAFAMADPVWRTAYEYLASNLKSMNDGKPVVSRKEKYRVLGTSTNEPIDAWLPEEGGVVAYIRERVGHILSAYYGANREHDKFGFRSLELLAEHGLEADEHGLFHRRQRPDADDDNPETAAALAASIDHDGERNAPDSDDAEIGEDERAYREALASTPRLPGEEESEQDAALFAMRAREAVRQLIDEQIAELKSNPTTRGDWPLRLFDSRFTATDGASPDVPTIRTMAKELLARLKNHDETLATDYHEIIKLIDEWDGSTSLVTHVPEFECYAEQFRYQLKGVDALPVRAGSSKAPTPAELMVASQSERAAETMELLFGAEVPGSGSSHVHTAVALDAISISDLLLSESDPELLRDPDRNDYEFLCRVTKTPKLSRPSPSELHAEMRELAKVWTSALLSAAAPTNTAAEFALRMRKWDPAQEHISGPINRAIHEMTQQDWEEHMKEVERTASRGQVSMDL